MQLAFNIQGSMFAVVCRRAALVLMIGCAALLSACKTELFGGLEESEANAVMMALYIEGIKATKVQVDDKLWRIEVGREDQQRAMAVARNHGVPRERFVNMGDLFKKEGLVSTPSEVRMRYIFALSQELSNTLSQIDGVISARVHPVVPVNDPLSEKIQLSSAAVFIKHLPDSDLRVMAPAIKSLVVRSIDELKPENVSVTFFAAPAPVMPPPVEYASPFSDDRTVSAMLIMIPTTMLALTWGILGWYMWRRPSKPARNSEMPSSFSIPSETSMAQDDASYAGFSAGLPTGNWESRIEEDNNPAVSSSDASSSYTAGSVGQQGDFATDNGAAGRGST